MSRYYERRAVAEAVRNVLYVPGTRSATVYLRPDLRVTATCRIRPKLGHLPRFLVLTIGRPNFAQRRAVKQMQRAGEPFPVRRAQLTLWPERKVRS